jgi:hypothetical protein
MHWLSSKYQQYTPNFISNSPLHHTISLHHHLETPIINNKFLPGSLQEVVARVATEATEEEHDYYSRA